MKYSNLLLFCAAFSLLVACGQNKKTDTSSSHGTAYGSPEASVTSEEDTARKASGPIAYGLDLPELSDKDTVDIKIDATNKIIQITRGVKMLAWPFGGTVPGPTIRVRQGQTVRFSMTNRSNEDLKGLSMDINGADLKEINEPMQHSIDFHAAMVNPEDKYRSIRPGQTIHFTWTANYPGVFMYHCATPMVLQHMIHGMLGTVIVDPKNGYPDEGVKQSFVISQNEFYLKKHGDIYLADTAAAMKKQPTYVTFNGKPAQYVVRPIKVKAGEKVRIYFMNLGPNNASSFHVIGSILDKVWIDGNPYNELHGLQSIYVGPASSAVIDVVFPEKGSYTFLDHSFADAEMGATGVFKAE